MKAGKFTIYAGAVFLICGFVIFLHEPMNQGYDSHYLVDLETLDIETLRFLLHGLLTSIEFRCKRIKRFGHAGYGGYDICISDASVIKPNSCLVYSFGINKDWSFDEAITSFFNCTSHAFDPSIGLQDHKHSTNIYFHNLGLAGNITVNQKGWRLSNLGAIKQNMGHSNEAIDVLKVDAEGAEWPLFSELATSNLNVKQLLVEVHTPTEKKKPMTKANYIDIIQLMRKLKEAGFVLFRNHHRLSCCQAFAPLLPKQLPEKCCHELSYVNTNYFH
jgi:hypothetical protein